MIPKERMERVQGYGLTEYEARAYLALLELDVATAREVAAVSRVPRTKIYEVLDELHRKQLVELIPERPKRYQAVPFESYLERYEAEYRGMLERIRRDKLLARQELVPSRSKEASAAGSFQVIKGRKNIMSRLEEMLVGSSRRFLVATTGPGARRLQQFAPDLMAIHAKGVDVRVVVHGDADATALGVPTFQFEGEASGTTVAVADGMLLVWHPIPDDSHAFHGDDVAMWTDDPVVVQDLARLVTHPGDTAPVKSGAASSVLTRRPEPAVTPVVAEGPGGLSVREKGGETE